MTEESPMTESSFGPEGEAFYCDFCQDDPIRCDKESCEELKASKRLISLGLEPEPELRVLGGFWVRPLGNNTFQLGDAFGSPDYPVVNGTALLAFMDNVCKLGENAAITKWTGYDHDADMVERALIREASKRESTPGEKQVAAKNLEDMEL